MISKAQTSTLKTPRSGDKNGTPLNQFRNQSKLKVTNQTLHTQISNSATKI